MEKLPISGWSNQLTINIEAQSLGNEYRFEDLTELLTDEVISEANAKGGNQYEVEQRTELRKRLASLRLAVAKTSAPEKTELLKKLERVSPE